MHVLATIIPTILCGGSGTRLWPLSREQHPKQLLPLTGKRTLLQETILRLDGMQSQQIKISDEPIILCNEEYRFLIAEQLRDIGCTKASIMIEPIGRNTAPALTLAAIFAEKEHPGQLLLVMPSDHIINNRTAFVDAVIQGVPSALEGGIVTFGIVPDRPETGYGYIKADPSMVKSKALPVLQFVEKPDTTTAKQYVASGCYFWNSGIFLLRADVWLQAVSFFMPDMLTICEQAVRNGIHDLDFFRIQKEDFASCPSDSIDYAVMEKLSRHPHSGIAGYVVPLDAGWSDLGAWDAVWNIADKDAEGNAVFGDVILEDTRNSLVYADGRIIGCVGLDNLIVVETADAVLVAHKNHAQNVKKVVTALKKSGRGEALLHRKVARPWGAYDCIDAGERFQVKRIIVKPGAVLSLQMHHHRAEHWIVVRGTAKITKGDETILLSENQSTYIPLGVRHRLENPGKVPLELIEVQSGSYLGEDDIVRFEDIYGRV